MSEVPDDVQAPLHYTYGKIETVDFIIDKQLNFLCGSAIKYIVRAGLKGDTLAEEIQDIQKAIRCLELYIERVLRPAVQTEAWQSTEGTWSVEIRDAEDAPPAKPRKRKKR